MKRKKNPRWVKFEVDGVKYQARVEKAFVRFVKDEKRVIEADNEKGPWFRAKVCYEVMP